jgi:hypothetical protein
MSTNVAAKEDTDAKQGLSGVESTMESIDKNDPGTQFLLAEFSEMNATWKHTDARIETAINFYLTVLVAGLPAAALLYQAIPDIQVLAFVLILMVATVFTIGLLLANRIAIAGIRKAEYQLSINLVRRYFLDHNSDLAKYVYFPAADPSVAIEDKTKQLKVHLHQMIYVVIVVNSLLVSLVIGWGLWLATSDRALAPGFGIISAISFLVCVFLLRGYYRKMIRIQSTKNNSASR